MTEGSHRQSSCQWLFFGCLALVGMTVFALVKLGARYWLFSAGTFSIMILGAIWDFRVHALLTAYVRITASNPVVPAFAFPSLCNLSVMLAPVGGAAASIWQA